MKTISQLKKHLDNIFSLYIRLRDATSEGSVQCFTCSRISHYKSGMQNGHFQSRRHHSTRWDETNCQVQCVKCNLYEQGEQFRFGIALDSKYGEGTSEELEFLARTITKLSRIDYEENISYSRLLLKS